MAFLVRMCGIHCWLLILGWVSILTVAGGIQHGEGRLTAWSFVHHRSGVHQHRAVRETTPEKPHITSMQVISRINSRFAQTVIHSDMSNPSPQNQLATFLVYLPDTAFISNFTMMIDGRKQVAVVKSKAEAEADFQEAQKQNKTAGKVEAKDPHEVKTVRGMEPFEVSVNVRPESTVQFELTYQQVLLRRLNWYEHKISIRPNQLVDDINVQVLVYEPQGITQLMVVEPGVSARTGNLDTEIVQEEGGEVATVKYMPSLERQQELDPHTGVAGDLVIKYDVQHSYSVGLVQIEDDYLVQYISPESNDLQPLPKNIIFVIDTSGSMSGVKMVQTREAVRTILGELREFDNFMMVLFNSKVQYWPSSSRSLVPATSKNVRNAEDYAQDNLVAGGSTNINDALVEAAKRLQEKSEQYGSNLVVFLTDGQPTVGVTTPSKIIQNVVSATEGKVSIFSLGFGDEYDLNFDLLKALSYRTGGFARRVVPGTDTGFQLTDFFLELNTPLLYDVKVVYPDNVMDKAAVTQTHFPQYFSGSELVVVGKLLEDAPSSWEAKVEAESHNSVELVKQVDAAGTMIPEAAAVAYQPGFVYKLFVYWKIKSLLEEELMTDNEVEKEEIRNYALSLAIENQLVTPLTSMIIVQSKDTPDDLYNDLALDPMMGPGGAVRTADLASAVYSGSRASVCGHPLILVSLMTLLLAA